MHLQMRTSRQFADLANAVTRLLWSDLSRRAGADVLDPHAFPALAGVVSRILMRRVACCKPDSDPRLYDAASKIGGGAPVPDQRLPVCEQHAERLQSESGQELADLVGEIERAVQEFIGSQRQARWLGVDLARHVAPAVESAVRPYLMDNLFTSHCDRCEADRRK